MKITEKPGAVHAEFGSVGELLDFGSGRSGKFLDPRRENQQLFAIKQMRHAHRIDFADGRNSDDVAREMANPPELYVAGVERAKRVIESIVDDLASVGHVRRRALRRNKDHGDDLDPQAWLARRTDGWSEVVKEKRKRMHVSIACNCAIPASFGQADLFYRGAVAVAVADIAAAKGFSVELWGARSVTEVSRLTRDLTMEFCVKSARQPMDIGSVAYSLASIAFYRICVQACNAKLVRGVMWASYGRPCTMPSEHSSKHDVVIDAGVFTLDSAVATVRTAIGVLNAKQEAARSGRE